MSPTETIITLTLLVELFLLCLLLWTNPGETKKVSHTVVRSRKYPRSRQNAEGVWVID